MAVHILISWWCGVKMSNFSKRRVTSDFTIVDGIPYIFDPTRNKTLSINRETYHFAHDRADSQYLRSAGLNAPGANSGFEIPNNATIVAFGAHARAGNTSKTFQIRRNNNSVSPLVIFSFPGIATPNISTSDDTLNVDIVAGDHLQVFATGPGASSNDVVVWIAVAWRI